jgi:hypothetical protein
MIRAFSAGVNGVASPVSITTRTTDIGFFLGLRGVFSDILPNAKALARGEAPMPVCRDVHDPRSVVLAGDVLQLHRSLATPQCIVIGTKNAAMIRYEDEWIALAAFCASRVRWKQCCAPGALVVEPPLHREAASGVTGGRSHAAVPGASLRRL